MIIVTSMITLPVTVTKDPKEKCFKKLLLLLSRIPKRLYVTN